MYRVDFAAVGGDFSSTLKLNFVISNFQIFLSEKEQAYLDRILKS